MTNSDVPYRFYMYIPVIIHGWSRVALYPYRLISFGLGRSAISVVAKRPIHTPSTEYKYLVYPYLTIQFKKSPVRV